jgi:hypothetical protein
MSVPESMPAEATTSARPQLLSSTATLFWRLFVPVFGTVMIAMLTVVLWILPDDELYLSFPAIWARTGATVVLAVWVWFVSNTFLKLYRVDATDEHVFVTNYWKTARYNWSDVEKCTESRRMGRRIAHIHLKGAGRFGQKISFLPTAEFDPQAQPIPAT